MGFDLLGMLKEAVNIINDINPIIVALIIVAIALVVVYKALSFLKKQ